MKYTQNRFLCLIGFRCTEGFTLYEENGTDQSLIVQLHRRKKSPMGSSPSRILSSFFFSNAVLSPRISFHGQLNQCSRKTPIRLERKLSPISVRRTRLSDTQASGSAESSTQVEENHWGTQKQRLGCECDFTQDIDVCHVCELWMISAETTGKESRGNSLAAYLNE